MSIELELTMKKDQINARGERGYYPTVTVRASAPGVYVDESLGVRTQDEAISQARSKLSGASDATFKYNGRTYATVGELIDAVTDDRPNWV